MESECGKDCESLVAVWSGDASSKERDSVVVSGPLSSLRGLNLGKISCSVTETSEGLQIDSSFNVGLSFGGDDTCVTTGGLTAGAISLHSSLELNLVQQQLPITSVANAWLYDNH